MTKTRPGVLLGDMKSLSASCVVIPVQPERLDWTQGTTQVASTANRETRLAVVIFPDGTVSTSPRPALDVVALLTFHEQRQFKTGLRPSLREFHRIQAKHVRKRLAASTLPAWVLQVLVQQRALHKHRSSKRRNAI